MDDDNGWDDGPGGDDGFGGGDDGFGGRDDDWGGDDDRGDDDRGGNDDHDDGREYGNGGDHGSDDHVRGDNENSGQFGGFQGGHGTSGGDGNQFGEGGRGIDGSGGVGGPGVGGSGVGGAYGAGNGPNAYDDPFNRIIYAAGAFSNSARPRAGYGVYHGNNDSQNVSAPLRDGQPTLQRAQLRACEQALTDILDETNITIRYRLTTDSDYAKQAIVQLAATWENTNWQDANGRPIIDSDIIRSCYNMWREIINDYEQKGWDRFEIYVVQPGSGDPGMVNATRLAREAAGVAGGTYVSGSNGNTGKSANGYPSTNGAEQNSGCCAIV